MELIDNDIDRFVMIPNETIDDSENLDFMALALLSVFRRHKSGFHITLPQIGKKYGYGEEAMTTAMGQLQVVGYVAKFRTQETNGSWSIKVVTSAYPMDEEAISRCMDRIADRDDILEVRFVEPTAKAHARHMKRLKKLQGK